MGFCVFNNVALAARYAQKKYGATRVLIADWDVHHGNGTQEVFYRDGSVLYFSTHLFPHYPGTGAATEKGLGKAEGLIINQPFPYGVGNREIVGAFRETLIPAARAFKPDFTLISAGFDSRKNDPLGGFQIDDDGFRELTRIMLAIAAVSGKGRLVSVLEGGYDLPGLAAAVCAHLEEMHRGI
jgi:acetoin utilization deacetylase AcuC-like enzyme